MNQPTRLFDFPKYQLEKKPLSVSLASKRNGKWIEISTKEYVETAENIALGLMELGIKPDDKVVLISTNNRFEWNFCDIGIMQCGAINVPVYPTASEDDYIYIFNDAEVRICFVSDRALYEKVMRIKPQVPTLSKVYVFDEEPDLPNFKEVIELGKSSNKRAELESIMQSIKPEQLATLIYTSGTTGRPKGVMLSHRNIASNVMNCQDRLPITDGGVALSFLPMCHIYERMLNYLYCYNFISVYYAESMDTIGDNLREVRPTIFTAVPRLLEKVFDKIMDKGAALTGIKKALFYWAVALAEEYDIKGKSLFYKIKLAIARKLIFKKWQEALGGRVLAVASGAAALNPRLCRIFLAAGINIQEGYGLTETSPVIAVNCPKNDGTRIGTVGRPINECIVKIADDGEILVKGPNVMMGYYKKPELTAEVIDADGFFHTGDIGEMVEGQFLKITDRKKEIFKTSGGKYIAPQIMENKFKESRFIEQIMVIGENEKHPAAFIQPDFVFLRQWCERKGIPYTSNEEIIKNPKVIERIQKEVDRYNEEFGNWEKIKKFELTPDVWSIEAGHLTPTMKLRRKVILKKYEDLYKKIYS
ncbi:AMP-dependent synthetase [Thermaurantimonas aggregans]|uniref:AMP-dependent synthetase n=1 Tax=Thermaurantimonas aggregans TaxID=2173829 RepID=A0A401XJF6_9FLAO|nr:AMP-dependent synthetase/ligase [Thermaurantimonas aggregans]MCX8148666.1 AMP-dependent synthetase/ligase [Thermaurantimonas aggregans]GCD77130.1 AMP-dependent synthetase [Thermaurantimonas aggregans]